MLTALRDVAAAADCQHPKQIVVQKKMIGFLSEFLTKYKICEPWRVQCCTLSRGQICLCLCQKKEEEEEEEEDRQP